ncbi:unnamed protein product [Schistosoma guineensis]|uniref:Brix domain-containing protein n=2 Tax=Schistosoma TaxID=6181 RepID=A0A183KYC9_9TREM|nr:ribosome production factor 1 [Schistosoma bovis]CAH8624920.1 unnamed protein product [Schistosoma guineensis]CAH8629497.1 unnamed protein product [Schistosoma curassoni]CAH8628820.1 unnamed protein product [Schistosoma bovis]CAH8633495.1 unnamed protein product [Schistosoma bovis]
MPIRKETTRHHLRDIIHKERIQKAKERRIKRKQRKESGAPAGIPQTLESLRTVDETIVPKDDEEVVIEHETDEFSSIFSGEITPKILLTHSDRVCPRTIGFCKELSMVIPNVHLVARWHLPLKKIIPMAIERQFTCLIIVNEDQKKINTLIVSHLPNGPTATFRLTNVLLRREMRSAKKAKYIESNIIPHLITTRFMTRLGLRTERILSSLFPNESRLPPQPHSRTIVFHNQRDYIFFRHYRYIHRDTTDVHNDDDNENEGKHNTEHIAMNEVGPKFTLKLRSIQLGTFDSQYGNYEWVRKRTEIGRSRRTFIL